jgi:AcrR family transcriptional regulator
MPARIDSNTNLAWGKKPPASRGPKPTLTAAQIARAAIQLADAKGLEAVTMQRVAREVGVTTMALYRYFPGKSDLLDLMIDSASDCAANFEKPLSPWSVRLKKWARSCLAIYRNHPWFLEATSVRRSLMGPNELSWMEAALAMLAESGLPPEDRHSAFLAVIGHVRGHATFEQMRKYNQSPEQWIRDLARALKSEARRYPALLKAVDSGGFSEDPARAFDFGLDCILDGIRSRVSQRRAKSRRRR